MSQEEQNEWPSFETVLRDVAPIDVARRTQTAIATSRRALATVDAARDERRDVSVSSRVRPQRLSDDLQIEDDESQIESRDESAATEDTLSLDLLPAPLPPLALDTSAVRALLEPRGANIEELDFELEALAPLNVADLELIQLELDKPNIFESAPDIFEPTVDVAEPELELDEADLAEPQISEPEQDDQLEVDSVFDLAFGDSTLQHEPTQEIELPDFDGTPKGIFDELGFENELAFDAGPFEQGSLEDPPLGTVFERDETGITASDSHGSDGDEQSDDAHQELHEGVTDLDTFDSVRTANEIEGDLSELFTFDTDFAEPAAEEDEDRGQEDLPGLSDAGAVDALDSAAGDLDSATEDLESDPFDNVVPIRPEPKDSATDESYRATETPSETNQPIETQPVIHAEHTGWVGLASTPETSDEVKDPWAYMRPTDEPAARNLWAKRPKFFGADERKRRKAERRDTATHATEAEDRDAPELELETAFDSECPNCGSECQVDLDDPIGRRVHVSCPSCDHMWFTPYIIESQAG